MIVKYYDRNLSFLGLSNATDVSGKIQTNKASDISFVSLDNRYNNAHFVEFIDQEQDSKKRIEDKFCLVESVDKDNKFSCKTMEQYLEQITKIPTEFRWWDRKNLKSVLEDHVKGFRSLTYASLSELNSFAESFHVKTDIIDTGNGEVYAATAPYFNSDNELYYYSDGYVIYRISMPTEAIRKGMVLRWKDSIGTTTDISVQFAWSDTETIPSSWSAEQSPVRGESITPNETEGVDIPENNLQYLYVRFNLKYNTGSKDVFEKGINYENEITTVDEGEKGNVVYHGKTALLYAFEVIYRVDTLINAGTISIPEDKILTADIAEKENLLESLKAICEAYGYVFNITKIDGLLYLNVYESYNVDRTNEQFISDKVNSIITKKDDKRTILEAVEAYGSGDGIDRIHKNVSIVSNPMNIGTFESETADLDTLEQEALAYIQSENDVIVSITFEFYGINFNLYDKVRISCNGVVFTSTITEINYNLTSSSFTKEYTVGLKQSIISSLFSPMFSGSFIPTIETPINIISNRSADGWIVSWTSNYAEHILEYKNETDVFWQRIFVSSNSVTLPFTEYKKLYSFRVYAIKDNFLSASSRTYMFESGENVSIGGLVDGTASVGEPNKITGIVAIAEENGIQIDFEHSGVGLSNAIKQFHITINKSETESRTFFTKNNTFFYSFDRDYDGYPEDDDLIHYYVSVRAENDYLYLSVPVSVFVDYSKYGTWKIEVPNVKQDSEKRTVILNINQPVRSDGKEIYGNILNDIQIRKVGSDPENTFYKPGINKDPLSSEDAYKDGEGFETYQQLYTQTLPLTGQNNTPPLPEATTYQYKIVARNEAHSSIEKIINFIALGTGIQDVVANAIGTNSIQNGAVVGDKIHVDFITSGNVVSEELSVIKAALGYILGDSFHYENGQKVYNNFVTLSTIQLDDGMHYEGDVRFGDENEYIRIKPIVVNNVVERYEVNFKAGVFTVESNKTTLNGEVIVQETDNTLDRTRITPTGTFYEHRDTEETGWYEISSTSTSGLKSTSLRSDKSLVISNASQQQTRKDGHDIGKKYLSENARVYHFDTDINDQKQNNDLVIEGEYHLVGVEDSNGIDYESAILAVSPYSNIAKSIYGKISITTQVPSTQVVLVDFWLQYLYAENQILFDIGTVSDKLELAVLTDEPLACKSSPSLWGDTYYTDGRNPNLGDNVFEDEYLTVIAGQIESLTVGGGFAVSSISVGGTIYEHTSGEPDWNWEIFAPESEWGTTSVPANRAAEGSVKIKHKGQTQQEEIELTDIGKEFKEYSWHHIGIQITETQIIFMFDDVQHAFNRFSVSSDEIDIVINQSKTSLICDELYIDTANQTLFDFSTQTEKRLPWGALDFETVHTIFDSDDPSKVKSNILDYFIAQSLLSTAFENRVKEIIGV